MPSSQDPSPRASQSKADDTADLAQTYKDLLRGEQAATALEANLTNLESKLDALLAAFEANEAKGAEKTEKKDDNSKPSA
jgi:hypothetical protein